MDENTRKQLLVAYNARQRHWYRQQQAQARVLKASDTRRMICLGIILGVVAWYLFFTLLPVLPKLAGLPGLIGLMLAG